MFHFIAQVHGSSPCLIKLLISGHNKTSLLMIPATQYMLGIFIPTFVLLGRGLVFFQSYIVFKHLFTKHFKCQKNYQHKLPHTR